MINDGLRHPYKPFFALIQSTFDRETKSPGESIYGGDQKSTGEIDGATADVTAGVTNKPKSGGHHSYEEIPPSEANSANSEVEYEHYDRNSTTFYLRNSFSSRLKT